MAKKQWMVSLVLCRVGVGCSVESLRLGLGSVHKPGMGFLPFLVGACLFIIAFFSVLIEAFSAAREKRNGKLFGGSLTKVLFVVVCLALYVLVLPYAGYLLGTFFLFTFLFKTGGLTRWSTAIIASLLAASISYAVFGILLNIRFPKGFLGV